MASDQRLAQDPTLISQSTTNDLSGKFVSEACHVEIVASPARLVSARVGLFSNRNSHVNRRRALRVAVGMVIENMEPRTLLSSAASTCQGALFSLRLRRGRIAFPGIPYFKSNLPAQPSTTTTMPSPFGSPALAVNPGGLDGVQSGRHSIDGPLAAGHL